jgi:hypothetical protein
MRYSSSNGRECVAVAHCVMDSGQRCVAYFLRGDGRQFTKLSSGKSAFSGAIYSIREQPAEQFLLQPERPWWTERVDRYR